MNIIDVRRFSQGNLSTSECFGNYANVRDERNPFVEGIEQTRDEVKSAYAITFPLPTIAYCVRVRTSRRANSVVEIANWDRQYQSRIEREDVSGSKGRRANGK